MSSISFASILQSVLTVGAESTRQDSTTDAASGGIGLEKTAQVSERRIRIAFWLFGLALALLQCWNYRYALSADGLAYLDMSDGASPISNWHRLINGVWSPLYPFLLGLAHYVHLSVYQEIVRDHFLSVAILPVAFLSFEYFLRSLMNVQGTAPSEVRGAGLPRSAVLIVGYSVFLWACLDQITFKTIRPDLLMGVFLYLAAGLLVRIHRGAASWTNFIALGVILGVGYLAKAPMRVVGMTILLCTLLRWRRTLVKAIAAAVLMAAIGSLYFVPLSKQLGHFSLGESSSYNYLFYINQATPNWYPQNPGTATGEFARTKKIFASPPTFEFHYPQAVTQPLRFDPLYWTFGTKPRFVLGGQFWAIVENIALYTDILTGTGGIAVALIILYLVSGPFAQAARDALRYWPILAVSLTGIAMYVGVHVEGRYVAVFFSMLWLALLAGVDIPRDVVKKLAPAVALGVVLTMVGPVTADTLHKSVERAHNYYVNSDAECAMLLKQWGVVPGSPVARISYLDTDLGWARLSHATIVAEVDYQRADEFWTSGQQTQDAVLEALAKTGAGVVVAHVRGNTAPAGWHRLGQTHYWVRRLA